MGWLGFGAGVGEGRESCCAWCVSVLQAGCSARRLAGEALHGAASMATAQGCWEAGRAGRLWQALGS